MSKKIDYPNKYPETIANDPFSEENLKELKKKMMSCGMKVQPRLVSWKEFKILEKMNSEGKCDAMGFPKYEYWDEYCELMRGDSVKKKR